MKDASPECVGVSIRASLVKWIHDAESAGRAAYWKASALLHPVRRVSADGYWAAKEADTCTEQLQHRGARMDWAAQQRRRISAD